MDEKKPVIWFHCASVGEATGISVVISRFVRQHPRFAILVTTMTETGLDYVRSHVPHADAYGLVPLDIPFIVRRVFRRVRPHALILLEGELWPGLLKTATTYDCPVALINGRMSDRSLSRNRFVKPLFRDMLRRLNALGVQHALDGERFIAFGAPPERVRVTGNVKFELAAKMDRPSRAQLRHDLGIPETTQLIMAGCPRPVEEEHAVVMAFTEVKEQHPKTRLIWAPRHLNRIPKVKDMLEHAGLSYTNRSHLEFQNLVNADVIILDTIGELSVMYAAADMAFVGATLVPLGGHNLLEPAACGIPVMFGPHIENVRASAAALLRTGGGVLVHDSAELAQAWLELLGNPQKRMKIGTAAAQAVRTSTKAVDRTLALLEKRILPPKHKESSIFGCLNRSSFYRRILVPDDPSLFIRLVRWVLYPGALFMGILIRLRNGLYDMRFLVPDRLSVPVISIGGLTVGGAGKTPVVRHLARRLKDAGYKPAVLSRGYGRETSGTFRSVPDINWQDVGDEPAFLASILPDIPVIVGNNRTSAGRLAVEQYNADVLLLDDGFQHRNTGRLVDIVVHDASQQLNPWHLLPLGPFREPLSSLRRASAVVLTRTDQAPNGVQSAETFKIQFPQLPVIKTIYVPTSLRRMADDKKLTLEWLIDRDLIVLCGIANPTSFAQTVSDIGGCVYRIQAYPDHHPFSNSDLDNVMFMAKETGVKWIITTEKDAVRIQNHPIRDHLVLLDIELQFISGEPALEKLLSTLDSVT